MARAFVVAAAMAAVAGIAVGVSARGGPAADERAVCGAAQAMVDRQSVNDYPGQLRELQRLETALARTDNRSLRAAGADLFAALTGPAPDPSGQTASETVELGRRYARQGAAAFDRILAACDQVGLEVRNLPSADKPAFPDRPPTTAAATTRPRSTSP